MSRMRRIGVFLLLGAIVNVAVAWVASYCHDCCMFYGIFYRDLARDSDGVTDDHVALWKRFAAVQHATRPDTIEDDSESLGYRQVQVRRWEDLPYSTLDGVAEWIGWPDLDVMLPQQINETGFYQRAGWPAKSMFGDGFWRQDEYGDEDGNLAFRKIHAAHGLLIIDDKAFTTIPLVPLWPGFAVNTLFYAAIAWMLFAALFAWRRRRRARRGLCAACAYPVGIGGVCTECGAAVTPRVDRF